MTTSSSSKSLNQREFHGNPRDARALGACLSELSTLSRSTGCPSVLLGRGGCVLAASDPEGRLSLTQTLTPAVNEEGDDDGWFQSGTTIYVHHQGRTFTVLDRGALAVVEVDQLPSNALRIDDGALTPILHVAAELCELYVDWTTVESAEVE